MNGEPANPERRWSYFEEARLCHYLISTRGLVDLSKQQKVLDELPLIVREMSRVCPRPDGPLTTLDVAKKLREQVDRYCRFLFFIHTIGVNYDEEINRVTVTPRYWIHHAVDEPRRNMMWRARGEPNYMCLKILFGPRGLSRVDFDWLEANAEWMG